MKTDEEMQELALTICKALDGCSNLQICSLFGTILYVISEEDKNTFTYALSFMAAASGPDRDKFKFILNTMAQVVDEMLKESKK